MRLRKKAPVTAAPEPLAQAGERRPVLIVSGPGGDGRRYRGDHRREQLEFARIRADICYRDEAELAPLADRYECFVLNRVAMDDDVARLVDAAPGRVVCDFDDLVFDARAAHWLRGLDLVPKPDRDAFVAGMAAQGDVLASCGRGILSTEPLERRARAIAPHTAVVYNVVSAEMLRQAEQARRPRVPRRRRVRVAYLSGTSTHDADFLEAADAVLACLGVHRNVTFVVAGFLNLDSRFDAFADRIERVPYRPWQRLPALQVTLDVNLAPLERDNPFTECKSCVKFLEASLFAVPTIASERADFVRVMRHGENGLLADNPDEWRDALLELVEDAEKRARLGERARADVLARHTTTATAGAAADALVALVPELSPGRPAA
jgi:O-antigen biosynthesis protein